MSGIMDLPEFDVDVLSSINDAGILPPTVDKEKEYKDAGGPAQRKRSRVEGDGDASGNPNSLAAVAARAAADMHHFNAYAAMAGNAFPGLETEGHAAATLSSSPSPRPDGNRCNIAWANTAGVKPCKVLNESMSELGPVVFTAEVDKGFKKSVQHSAFICQKKNHFQVTVSAQFAGTPSYVVTSSGVMAINKLVLKLYGVKCEKEGEVVPLDQSMQNRSKKPFNSLPMDLRPNQTEARVTVCRLHFTETTANNMRKRGKPNPDQRFFSLVATLAAVIEDGTEHPLASITSDKLIVRASNPGQFESEAGTMWTRSANDGICYNGMVGINNAVPEEALSINGNLAMTGTLMQPSDMRVKTNLQRCNSDKQLANVRRLSLYKYDLRPEWANSVGIDPSDALGHTGVLAQELAEVLPDAVRVTGDRVLTTGERVDKLLVVNKDRLLMEGLGALKALARQQDATEARLVEVEKRNSELKAALARRKMTEATRMYPVMSPLHSYLRLASILCFSK
eukprot:m.186824 g.186824  ORF g.186824 m.186824 type:complete len:509 (+) comp16881_c0_seq1:160-1686(+)